MALTVSSGHAQIIISDWTFNNIAQNGTFLGMNGGVSDVGSFSTAAASYGEVYNSSTLQLSSNTDLGVYSGSNVYLSFAGTYTKGSYDTNGGYPNDYGYGAGFDDTGTNVSTANTPGGSGGDGSLLVYCSQTDPVDFHLSTTNFTNLSLSFQVAATVLNGSRSDSTTNYTGATYTLEYSLDGNINDAVAIPGATNVKIAGNVFSLQSLALPAALANTSSFDLYFVPNLNGPSGGVELDDFALSGAELAVPEPQAWSSMLFGAGALALFIWVRRERKLKV